MKTDQRTRFEAFVAGEARVVEEAGGALVFFLQDDAVAWILVTTRGADGLLVPMMSC